MNDRDRKMGLLNSEAEVLVTRILLDELRAGRVANALELLEQRIDAGVMMIHGFSKNAEPAEHERVAGTLRIIREYRQRHPRKTEAVMEGAEGVEESVADADQKRAKVQRILDESQ
jgi:hypothetical protein